MTKLWRVQVLAGWGWLGRLVSEIRESWTAVSGGKGGLKLKLNKEKRICGDWREDEGRY